LVMNTKPQALEPSAIDAPAHKMLIGAEALAQFIYGEVNGKTVRDIYRNIADLPFFHHGNSLAGFTDTIVAELRQHERQAREELQRKRQTERRKIVKPRRRRARQSHQQVAAE
jgi:hypothetical protein